ncbi:MAG TPA: division/cell wall cluster transcriptional repressor MraZ [Bacteroidia bacterium]|nr:division/cell wall cluster transcriptional repressor MraZ [Bacteroidia bacterium]
MMTNFIGEYECKVDSKGRVMLPSGLKKQISPAAQEKFVVNRGFEKHLNLYPMDEWQKISKEVNKLNLYVAKNREFLRKFNNGATELELDTTSRFLMPKKMMEYAGIEKEIVLFAFANRIEIWSKAAYEKLMAEDSGEDFASLAEDVMGKTSTNTEEENVIS